MWNNANELVVASNGQVYAAPVGTALPTTNDEVLNVAFIGTGLCTEDGVSISNAPNYEEFMSWQSRRPTRRERTADETTANFVLQQHNEYNLPLAFGGGEVISDGATGWRYNPPTDGEAVDERSFVIDAIDGSYTYRWVFERATVTEAVELQYQRSSLSELPIALKILAPADNSVPFYLLTNDPAFTAGS